MPTLDFLGGALSKEDVDERLVRVKRRRCSKALNLLHRSSKQNNHEGQPQANCSITAGMLCLYDSY